MPHWPFHAPNLEEQNWNIWRDAQRFPVASMTPNIRRLAHLEAMLDHDQKRSLMNMPTTT